MFSFHTLALRPSRESEPDLRENVALFPRKNSDEISGIQRTGFCSLALALHFFSLLNLILRDGSISIQQRSLQRQSSLCREYLSLSLSSSSSKPLSSSGPHLIRLDGCEQTGGGTGICYGITKTMMERKRPLSRSLIKSSRKTR